METAGRDGASCIGCVISAYLMAWALQCSSHGPSDICIMCWSINLLQEFVAVQGFTGRVHILHAHALQRLLCAECQCFTNAVMAIWPC